MITITAYPQSGDQIAALKSLMVEMKIDFDEDVEPEEKPYNPEFVAELEISLEQFKEGKTKNLDKVDLKKYLGLE